MNRLRLFWQRRPGMARRFAKQFLKAYEAEQARQAKQ